MWALEAEKSGPALRGVAGPELFGVTTSELAVEAVDMA